MHYTEDAINRACFIYRNLIHNPLMCDCVLVAALSDLKGKTIGYCESTNWEFETVASLMKKVNCGKFVNFRRPITVKCYPV